jgi:hypothetical protein
MHTGKKHDYLGVDMEFKDDVTLEVSMIAYTRNVIAEFLEIFQGKAATPAADHLYTVRDENLQNYSRRKEHWRFITRWHNCCSCQPEQDVIFKWQSHS